MVRGLRASCFRASVDGWFVLKPWLLRCLALSSSTVRRVSRGEWTFVAVHVVWHGERFVLVSTRPGFIHRLWLLPAVSHTPSLDVRVCIANVCNTQQNDPLVYHGPILARFGAEFMRAMDEVWTGWLQ